MKTLRFVAAASIAWVLALPCVCWAQVQAPPQPGTFKPKPTSPPPATLHPAPQPPLTSPFDPKTDVRAAIEEAKKQAAAMRGRVLVVWAADPQAMYTKAMIEALDTADLHQRVGLEFAVVWALIGEGERAGANRELAKSLGAEVTAKDVHPTLTILTQAGKPVASRSAIDMVDPVRTSNYTVLTVNDYLSEHVEPPPVAQKIVDEALAKAAESKRCVLLSFGQFGEPWSWKFKSWLAQPAVSAVMAKYAVVTHVELLRDKGAFDVMEKLGGVKVQSLPWFVILNSQGKPVGASQSEKMPNIGFPSDEGEITAFLGLIRAGNPALSDADAKALRDSLVAAAHSPSP